jgi:hypothetical protein
MAPDFCLTRIMKGGVKWAVFAVSAGVGCSNRLARKPVPHRALVSGTNDRSKAGRSARQL